MPRVRLEVIEGADTMILALRLPTIIGRGEQARVKIRNARVSRRHCELYDFDGQLAVRDLDSSNGTFVNGQRISGPTFLAEGDQLTVGPITLKAISAILPDIRVDDDDRPSADKPSKPKATPDADDLPIAAIVAYDRGQPQDTPPKDDETPTVSDDPPNPVDHAGLTNCIDVTDGAVERAVDDDDSQLRRFLSGH
ncbi:MAG: FHA domain-containing protein [Planctomycetales bacterium]|nr:FHA domain-containing protein [Planctomycetales bacterium]